MLKKILVSLFLSQSLISACGRHEDSASTLQEAPRSSASVSRLGDGLWMRVPPSSRFQPPSYSFWIDLAVSKGSGKFTEAGVVWTVDDWKTSQTTKAVFENGLDGGREKWGVDVNLPPQHVNTIEYAAYIKVNGQTIWDAQNNHLIGNFANRDIFLTRTETKQDTSGFWFEGGLKVKNIAPEKQIIVQFQRDQGAPERVAARYVSGNDWTFRIPLTPPRSTELRFKLEYVVAGKTLVDDNDGRLYTYQIGPRPYRQNGNSPRLAGYEIISFADSNIHEWKSFTATINGKPVATQGLSVFLDAALLYPETSVELKVVAEDVKGFRTEQVYPFEVSYQVKALGSFGTQEFRWPRQLKIQNDVLFVADYLEAAIFTYNSTLQLLEKKAISRPLQDIAPYGSGNTATLSGLENPTLDLYNAAGELVQSQPIPADMIELPVQLEASSTSLYVLSYYENSIAVFDHNGQYQRKFTLPYTVKGFKVSGNEIWVLAYDNQGFESSNQYFEVLDLDGHSLRKLNFIQQAAKDEFGYAQDFAVSDDYIVILQNYQFVVLDRKTGLYLTKWTGITPQYADEGSRQVEGAISSTAMSVAIQGNTLYVADFGYHRVSRFELKL
jgi:hypothetical protein